MTRRPAPEPAVDPDTAARIAEWAAQQAAAAPALTPATAARLSALLRPIPGAAR